MNAKPAKPCGRLDRHDAHTWTRHPHLEGHALISLVPAVDYHCGGLVLIEGGYWGEWGAA